jgi:hypothetical protein
MSDLGVIVRVVAGFKGFARRAYLLFTVMGSFVLVGGLVVASFAHAGKGVVSAFGGPGSGDGQFANAGATAVSLSSGDVYVLDQGDNRVEQFDSQGVFIRAWGWGVADGKEEAESCTSSCQAGIPGAGEGQLGEGAQGIAIDQASGALYLVDSANSRVEKFSNAGTYQSQFGVAGSGDGQFSGPQGIAVDPSDQSIYVADTGDHRVEKFSAAGVYQSQFGSEGSADGQFEGPTRVAVDSTGLVYVLDSGNSRIERFTAADAFDEVFDPSDVFLPSELAIGPGNDHLYVAQWAQDFSEQRVVEIDSAGTLVDTHAVGAGANNPSGLALSSAAQKIYLADGGNAHVLVLGDLTAPTASIDPPASVTGTSAALSGAVNPHGAPAVGWRFEISTDDASWSPAAADQDASSGSSDVPVSMALTGLAPNTTYFVRLAATRPFNTTVLSSEVHFTTEAIGPEATTQPVNDIGPTHATFEGVINPHNSATTYYFQYGTTTAYGTSLPASQDANAGSGDVSLAAIQRIDGLAPGSAYHYRLVAHNNAGTTLGQDQAFTTTTAPPPSTARDGIPGTGFLPEERGWEEVSPPNKHGSDVAGDTSRTRAASGESPATPMAATFFSLGGFGDVRGTGISTEYMSVRDGAPATNGWSTHAITPPQSPLTTLAGLKGFEPEWEGELSDDLSKGVFRAYSPVTDEDPNVVNAENLYRRDDLREPGAGSYQLATPCVACEAPLSLPFNPQQLPRLAGASADFSHVLFQSIVALTPDATDGKANLYEWVNGTLRLAGILPDSACGAPPCPAASSIAGQSAGADFSAVAHYTPHTISADGSRVMFTDPSTGNGLSTGSLYVRIDGTSTVQVNASEKTNGSGPDGSDPNGHQPARYWNASADGSRVFFTTNEQLTNDDTDTQPDLYMYDLNAAPGHHLTRLSVDHEPADQTVGVDGVVGVSEDGHYAYFIASGQLVAGQPVRVQGHTLYLWHNGQISYIGELAAPTDTAGFVDLPGTWNLVQFGARVPPDGKHLLFTTHSEIGLTDDDQGSCGGLPCAELYVYSAESHRLQCASCNPSGAPAAGSAQINIRSGVGASDNSSHLSRAISDDGRRVFFTTADALVPQDINNRLDAYVYDVPSGTVHLLSSGTDEANSYFMDASSSGDDAFILTRQQLVGWDTDQNYDLYDARVNGGFPDPVVAPTCSGEACQGQPTPTAPDSAPGGVAFDDPGNLAPSPPRAPVKPLTRAQKLAKALRVCRSRHGHRRRVCERQARKRYGPTKAKKSGHTTTSGKVGR